MTLTRFVSMCLVLIVGLSVATTSVIAQSLDRIFYSTFSPQGWDIYLSLDDGETFQKVAEHPSLDYGAVVSPDSRWIIFTSERSGMAQLYVLPIDDLDSEPRPLFVTGSFQDQAAFSPDGAHIAFVGSHEGQAEIYVAPFTPDSTLGADRLTNITNNSGGDFRPSFSPDGSQIVFTSDRDHEIIPHPQFPFARQRGGDIYVVGVDGSGIRRLTESPRWDGTPYWSSIDGHIYFYSQREGTASIFRMATDGSGQERVFDYEGHAVMPTHLDNGDILFTTWLSETEIKPMRWVAETGEIVPFLTNLPHITSDIKINAEGVVVYHGGDAISQPESAVATFGFPGEPLAQLPDTIEVDSAFVNIFGVRRAFVAPPGYTEPVLYFDSRDASSFWDIMQPLGYTIFVVPVILLLMALYGLVAGLQRRKYIQFRKHAIFSVVVILATVVSFGLFLYIDAVELFPVSRIMAYMTPIIILLALQLYFFVKWYRKMSRSNPYEVKLRQKYIGATALLLVGLTIITFGYNSLMVSDLHFYSYNYDTGEKNPVFTLKKPWNTNALNFNVLDSKVTHDGESLLITTGSFHAGPLNQGDIWKYDFGTETAELVSTTEQNDGFADMSADNIRMVFRSGRSGDFDIYLNDGGRISKLTDDAHRDNFPAISPDGMKVVFASNRLHADAQYKTFDIFMMTEQARNTWSPPKRISIGAGQNAHPHFSPDGQWVIYTTEGYGINDEQPLIQGLIFSPQMYGEIVAYHVETKERIRLTHNKWEDGAPLWVRSVRDP